MPGTGLDERNLNRDQDGYPPRRARLLPQAGLNDLGPRRRNATGGERPANAGYPPTYRMRASAMTRAMTRASGLHRACRELFADYPLAVRFDNDTEAGRSMVLTVPGEASFYVLWLDYKKGEPVYSLGPWPAGDIAVIPADDTAPPEPVAQVITDGVPIPRDGSLFGSVGSHAVTALIVIYAEYAPECPVPSWTVMPLADSPESQWPSFTDEHLFGRWFWDQYWAGRLVSLSGLVAETPDTVFWVDTKALIGSDCCAVARDVISSEGYRLQRGRYAYFQALRAGKPVPPLDVLLDDVGKIDLAPRFDRSGCR